MVEKAPGFILSATASNAEALSSRVEPRDLTITHWISLPTLRGWGRLPEPHCIRGLLHVKRTRLSRVHPARKFFHRVGLDLLPPVIRRTLVAVIGGTIVIVGLLLVFLPGPGALVILLGLAVLGSEFVWARRLIKRARELGKQGSDYVKSLVTKP